MKPEQDKLYQFLHKVMMGFGKNCMVKKSALGGYTIDVEDSPAGMQRVAALLVDVCEYELIGAKMNNPGNVGFAASLTLTMDASGRVVFKFIIQPSVGSWFHEVIRYGDGQMYISGVIGNYEAIHKIKKEI